MADTISTSYELKLESAFADGDTRTLTVPDPIADNESIGTIAGELESLISNGGTSTLIIGDKTGAAFTIFNKAVKTQTTTSNLDLT